MSKEKTIKSTDLVIDYISNLNMTHIKEAETHGLTLLHRSNSRVYGWFRINKCNHEAFLHYGAVRKAQTDEFKCTECLNIKLQEEASKWGAKLIGNREIGMRNDQRRYLLKCGHEVICKTGNVRRLNPECKECINTSYVEAADRNNLKLVGESESSYNRVYELPCGHTKEISLQCARENTWKCVTCQEDRYEREAVEAGIVMNRDVKSHHHDYRNYTMKCGCSRDIPIAGVRKGTFECKNHPERFIDFSKKISVYLVKFKLDIGDIIKVGFAMDVNGRFQRYGLNGKYEPLFIRNFENGQDAVNLEKQIHIKFNHLKVDKELMRGYMENGFTECYPVECLNLLMEALNE